MSTMSALEIADLIKEKAMVLTTNQPVNGYTIGENEKEDVWIIAQADFDYQHGALVQLITPTIPRPYIMIWWWTQHVWHDDEGYNVESIDRTEVEWIHNSNNEVTWADAIRMWGAWIEDVTNNSMGRIPSE